ncbi:beta-lactamase family protein [Ideonella azotifigens]|uniref:Serine hydrolase domain-containing protein n=1 Tax=Ideonella azotifigens TaxID=513160 RepID=A0ABN1KLW7_9BURK|nr:serine hydrolase [Ideonella azotifigens]MCD2343342.1 beta-lactamase family protein [Ideonella azotifigens]
MRWNRVIKAAAAAALWLDLAGCQSVPPEAPLLAQVLQRWDEEPHHDLRSVVVMHQGRIVAERYFNGETAETLHDVRSAGKSVTSLLVAMAVDQGKIRSLADPVQAYWTAAKGSAIGDVALSDVLTMRSGLAAFDEDPVSAGQEDKLDDAADPLGFALGVPRADPPGTVYRYNSLTAYVAGLVVEQASGLPLRDFARVNLFEPLGIRQWRWDADVAGHTKGQGNLWLTARGMAALGELVRNKGEYQGRRVISEDGVAQMLQPRVAISTVDPYADGYGYFWYFKAMPVGERRLPVWFASGNGGNKVYVLPEQALVVTVASSAYGRGYGQRRSQEILHAVLTALPELSGPRPR